MNTDLLQNIYGKSLFENEKNITFWENYLQNLHVLDLNFFAEKLTVPVFVPIGSRILFRGELKHTNEITVALGADYFAKCSVKQAEILKQHRIKDAKSKLELLKKERVYLDNQLSFSKQTIIDDESCNIIEVATEEEDKNWRELHRENVRQYKQRKNKSDELPINEVSDEELFNRLEELELQEELENELSIDNIKKNPSKESHNIAETDDNKDSDDDDDIKDMPMDKPQSDKINDAKVANEIYQANYGNSKKVFQQPSKLHLFEQVVDRHNALKEMVAEMRVRQKRSRTEDDLVARLDDMEKLEELEDEIAILKDMLALDDDDDDDIEEAEEEENADTQLKKSVAFADEDDSETFELTFKHSEIEPSREPFDPQKGITKPSDLRAAYSINFNSETTSILKKPKCGFSPTVSNTIPIKKEKEEANQDSNMNSTIVVRDVVEKVDCNDNNLSQNARPISLFKKRRQQLKE